MSDAVLDASVVLAAMLHEPGGDRVGAFTGKLLISAVNYAEVGAKLFELGHQKSFLDDAVSMLGLDVVPFDAEQADRTAALRPATRGAGLSLGDRACLALAMSRNALALTADPAWQRIELPVRMECVR